MKASNTLRALAFTALALTVMLTLAQDQPAPTDEEKIADAMNAAPASVAEAATIMDWPTTEGGEMTVLREGANGWVCYPTNPVVLAADFNDPMCLDEVWQGWLEALLAGEEPTIETIGVAYMLSGDGGASNIDPFATGPTDDNEWHVSGPHTMILMPNQNYEGISTDHTNGGPYVMWAETPYAHIMVPIEPHLDH